MIAIISISKIATCFIMIESFHQVPNARKIKCFSGNYFFMILIGCRDDLYHILYIEKKHWSRETQSRQDL